MLLKLPTQPERQHVSKAVMKHALNGSRQSHLYHVIWSFTSFGKRYQLQSAGELMQKMAYYVCTTST